MVQIVETERITAHITRVPLPLPYDLLSMNSYVIEGHQGLTILDTGEHNEETKAIWQQIIGTRTVEKVVLTHGHGDHLGCANWLRDTYGATIYMFDKTVERMEHLRYGYEHGYYDNLTTKVFATYGVNMPLREISTDKDLRPYIVEPDVVFTTNDLIALGDDMYRVLYTPGHADDHVCFYNEAHEILFLGDHVIEAINPVLLATPYFLNPLGAYLASLEELRTYRVQHALPGHLQIVPDFAARVERLQAHHLKRVAQTYEAVANGHATLEDITVAIYKKARHSTYAQVVAMLHYLVAQHKIQRVETSTFPIFTLLT